MSLERWALTGVLFAETLGQTGCRITQTYEPAAHAETATGKPGKSLDYKISKRPYTLCFSSRHNTFQNVPSGTVRAACTSSEDDPRDQIARVVEEAQLHVAWAARVADEKLFTSRDPRRIYDPMETFIGGTTQIDSEETHATGYVFGIGTPQQTEWARKALGDFGSAIAEQGGPFTFKFTPSEEPYPRGKTDWSPYSGMTTIEVLRTR